jgi:hypothetical protein
VGTSLVSIGTQFGLNGDRLAIVFIPALNVNHGTSLLGSFDWVGALVRICV